jgi:hypothetical protein
MTSIESNFYLSFDKFDLLLLVLYVDNLIIIGDFDHLILWCKKKLASELDMKGNGLLHYFFGLEILQVVGGVFLVQGKYNVKISKRFQMLDHKPIHTHMVPNQKLTCDEDSDLVDLTLYRIHKGVVELDYIPTYPRVANTLTKTPSKEEVWNTEGILVW